MEPCKSWNCADTSITHTRAFRVLSDGENPYELSGLLRVCETIFRSDAHYVIIIMITMMVKSYTNTKNSSNSGNSSNINTNYIDKGNQQK